MLGGKEGVIIFTYWQLFWYALMLIIVGANLRICYEFWHNCIKSSGRKGLSIKKISKDHISIEKTHNRHVTSFKER